jgi:universal stress protein E
VKRPKSILMVVERAAAPAALLRRSIGLARALGARLELFLCDSEQAYVLGHSYDRHGVLAARNASISEARRYLSALRDAAGTEVEMSIDAECESPLYESVVRKVLRSAPDMVVKAMGVAAARTSATRTSAALDPNDWQLMRTCPVTLMLTGARAWRDPPRLAAAIDVSDAEPEDLAKCVMETSVLLAECSRGELHVVYGERDSGTHSRARLEKLHRLCAEAGVAPDRTHVLSGEPERTLPVFLREQGFDALVLGALSHRSTGTTPVGTLTSTLLDTLACDFVLVKPVSYRSPVASATP